jgi:hypothetical protein
MGRRPFAIFLAASALVGCGESGSGPVDGGFSLPDAGAPTLSGLLISRVLAPIASSNGQCSYTSSEGQASLSMGNVDVSFSSLQTYTPEVLVLNESPTSRATIRGTLTSVTDLEGNDLVTMFSNLCQKGDTAACQAATAAAKNPPKNPFTTDVSVTVAPSTEGLPSYAPMALTMIDAPILSLIASYFTARITAATAPSIGAPIELITYTRLEGMLSGGDAGDSMAYEFPVVISYAGLVSNLQPCPDPSCPPVSYCLSSVSPPYGEGGCVPGQDVPTAVPPSAEPSLACPGVDAGG